jgi:hypothetical protein
MLFVLIGILSYNIFDYVIPIIISSWLIFHILRIGSRVKLMNNKILYITIILYSVKNMRIASCSDYSQLSKILATDGYTNEFFGSSVSINNNNSFIGAFGDDKKGTDSGMYIQRF